ncbi:MAG: RluA family pseudouridine synthase [Cytophagales bacterium]|nr:RluA family pseudouridine synthase [Cytophagales bacterium]
MNIAQKFAPYFKVLYEDNHLIAVDKVAGILVQPDTSQDPSLADMVTEYIRLKYSKQGNVFCGVIHRNDRPVSGLILMAKTSKMLSRMNELFRNGDVQKTYLALVYRKPKNDEDILIHWLKKDVKKNFAICYTRETDGSQRAELSFKIINHTTTGYLLEIQPKTGRFHQIRAQLSKIGCPIIGDLKYGYETPNEDKSVCLHGWKAAFVHPVQNVPVMIETSLPQWACL